jgi:hypothetical protein
MPTAAPGSFFQFEERDCGIFTQPMQLGDAFAICMSLRFPDGAAAEQRAALQSAETSRSASGTDSYGSQGRGQTHSFHCISYQGLTYLIGRRSGSVDRSMTWVRSGARTHLRGPEKVMVGHRRDWKAQKRALIGEP